MLYYYQSNGKLVLTERCNTDKVGLHLWVQSLILGGNHMERRVAVIGIIVENTNSVSELNAVLSEYGDYIIGRMGIPYAKKNINCITVVVDAESDKINTLCGKIGKIDGVSSKAAFSNV